MQGAAQGGTIAAINHLSHKLKTIRTTKQAIKHYYAGDGESVNLHRDIRKALINNKKFQAKLTRIVNGETTSLDGNFGINLTSDFFHLGDTNVEYHIKLLSKGKIKVSFDLFVNDGFWDPDVLSEFLGLQIPDGLGPNLEFPGGTPYSYIQQRMSMRLRNPGYKR